MIESYIQKKLMDFAFNKVSNIFQDEDIGLKSNKDSLEKSLSHHLNMVKNWSEEISFYDLKKSKNTEDVYVQLDLLLSPLRSRLSKDETIKDIPLIKALDTRDNTNHFIILGQPGAGKTTTMKCICREMLIGNENFLKNYNFPILIRLREINKIKKQKDIEDVSSDIIWSILHEILGIEILYPKHLEGKENKSLRFKKRKGIIKDFLEKLAPIILLDGFDEIEYKTHKEKILYEIRELGLELEDSCIIVTSRTGDFNYSIDKFDLFEIKALDEKQIETFAYSWLDTKNKAQKFLNELITSPFEDTAIRPLTLSHLCAIFDRIGKVPEKPKTVYKKVVNLLIEEWDEQRSLKRESSYSLFEADRKFEFLSNLAYILTVMVRKTIFNSHDLEFCYNKMFDNYGLPKKEARKVANELESHTGLFIKSGYNSYEFSHKSIQEYLTAEYLVKLPTIPDNEKIIVNLANELAISISISSNPSEYFIELILNRLLGFKNLPNQFFQTFVNRLLVEKPDFHRSDKVTWALISLYTLYFKAITNWKDNYDGQMALFIPDSLSNEFVILDNLIKERITKSIIKKIYVQIKEEWTDDNKKIISLKKKEIDLILDSRGNLPYSKSFIKKSLPNVIMIKEDLIL